MYPLGENINSERLENGRDYYDEKLRAIEQLKTIGFISEYEIRSKREDDEYYLWDYAVCKINEGKITQKEAASATEARVKAIIQKVVHEHTHEFKNSIQEKDIRLNIKNVDENVVVKNNKKRITLPKFPRTEWSKVSITFLDERNVLLASSKNTKPSSFEGPGCDNGRNGKPDENWNFLIKLALGQRSNISHKQERQRETKEAKTKNH